MSALDGSIYLLSDFKNMSLDHLYELKKCINGLQLSKQSHWKIVNLFLELDMNGKLFIECILEIEILYREMNRKN